VGRGRNDEGHRRARRVATAGVIALSALVVAWVVSAHVADERLLWRAVAGEARRALHMDAGDYVLCRGPEGTAGAPREIVLEEFRRAGIEVSEDPGDFCVRKRSWGCCDQRSDEEPDCLRVRVETRTGLACLVVVEDSSVPLVADPPRRVARLEAWFAWTGRRWACVWQREWYRVHR